jgi:hypothetical protein
MHGSSLHTHLGSGSPHETIGRIRVVTDIHTHNIVVMSRNKSEDISFYYKISVPIN